jgi:hypothetical protein
MLDVFCGLLEPFVTDTTNNTHAKALQISTPEQSLDDGTTTSTTTSTEVEKTTLPLASSEQPPPPAAITTTTTTPTTHDDDDDEWIGPIYNYDDWYVWPNLYIEMDEMLEACILTYPLTELRRLARQHKIGNPDAEAKILTLPLTHEQVMDVVIENESSLVDTRFGKDRLENIYFHSLLVAQHKNRTLAPETIVAVDDEYEKHELVYTVQVNPKRERVTVAFRGSVTKSDWATDFQIFMKSVPNPVRSWHKDQPETIQVHSGFYNYVFEPTTRGEKGPNGEALSEYQEILLHHVVPILQTYPTYKLYVTGHSLGAALATLFAFSAAAEPDYIIPKPVSLFSIAGPYVGDLSFRTAHQGLEKMGKLRHVRVSNHKDLVTIVPKISFTWNFLDPTAHVGTPFKHVGINIRLYPGPDEGGIAISYPQIKTGYWSSMYDEWTRGWEQSLVANFPWNPHELWTWPWHSVQEYKARMDTNKAQLERLHANDIYARRDVVGHLLAQF